MVYLKMVNKILSFKHPNCKKKSKQTQLILNFYFNSRCLPY